MATRPVFVPVLTGDKLAEVHLIEFKWSFGFAESQKKKNVRALHDAAANAGIRNILEVSSKSDEELGKRLSAFSLKYEVNRRKYPLESVYQGSKVFQGGGPFTEIFDLEPREAKRFIWQLDRGEITGYRLEGKNYPLSPPNAFYDWLYIRALAEHADWIAANVKYEAFTDIEFNPRKQINCQARALAEFLSLLKQGNIEKVCNNFERFKSILLA